ncbi:secretion protein F [Dehalobacter restrictus]|uniref:type II secretion system F family protein n=1 Tax=Dehalobacter restrictus TaxID=55583 RepID=UPI00338F062D
MYVLLFFFALFFAAGIYFVLADTLNLPALAATKAVLTVARQDKKQTMNLETVIFELSSRLSRFITIDGYKRRKLEASLKSAGMKLTPETYLAKAWVKAGLTAFFILPVLPIFPILAPVILFLAVAIFFRERQAADEMVRQKREKIEYELPRFVSTISQELKASRDVLSILKSYQKNAEESFKQELEITIADMKSGNEETALTRFEARIGSTMLSDVVRGLISVKRGDNSTAYFEMLSHDFKLLELQRLKLVAMKRPGKVRKYSFFMLGCLLLMYLGVLGYEIMHAFGKLF